MKRTRLAVAAVVSAAAIGGGTVAYLSNDSFDYEASPERLAELEEQRIESEAELKEQEAEMADASTATTRPFAAWKLTACAGRS